MSIWTQLYGSIRGGWKTHGVSGIAAFDSDADGDLSVTEETALKLQAVHACLRLRAEIIGTLPIHLRDKNKRVLTDHPLYDVLHRSPNAQQTAAEYESLCSAHVDMHGNSFSVIERRGNGSVISLEPIDSPDQMTIAENKSGRRRYKFGQEEWPEERILHRRGFSMVNGWGLSRLSAGRTTLSSQIAANNSALKAFQQGLKIGGFFKTKHNLSDEQIIKWKERLDQYARDENAGKWLTMMPDMEPVGGAAFKIKPAEAELLQSRYFGIEEICRLFGVPPQLIGHTDKASSWASSSEQINLNFLTYGVNPSLIRSEQRMEKMLLTPEDRGKGIEIKYNIRALLRTDSKTQSLVFASALQNGYHNRDEVREWLDLGPIPDGTGQEFTIQTNMQATGGDPNAKE